MTKKYQLDDPSIQPEHGGTYLPQARLYFRKIAMRYKVLLIILTLTSIGAIAMKAPLPYTVLFFFGSLLFCTAKISEYGSAGQEPN